jgi:hypothetical protein
VPRSRVADSSSRFSFARRDDAATMPMPMPMRVPLLFDCLAFPVRAIDLPAGGFGFRI